MFKFIKLFVSLLINSKINILITTFSMVGAISGVVTVLAGLTTYEGYGICGLLVIFGVSITSALVLTFIRLKKITFKTSDKVTIDIKIGDIFESEGIVVIPVDEYFFPEVDNNRISSRTLHGMFIDRVYKSNTSKLKKKLEEKLKDFKSEEGLNSGEKYPLGTAINIEEGGKEYILIALSRIRHENTTYKAYLKDINEYQKVIKSLLNQISYYSQGKKVSIPLIGAGQSGVDLSEQVILENLINSFKTEKSVVASGGIEIFIYPNDISKINFARMKTFEE